MERDVLDTLIKLGIYSGMGLLVIWIGWKAYSWWRGDGR